MKMLVIFIAIWILIVPSLVASFLILTTLAAFVPQLYVAVAWFGIAFTAAALLCGPFGQPSDPLDSLPSHSAVARLGLTTIFRGGKQ